MLKIKEISLADDEELKQWIDTPGQEITEALAVAADRVRREHYGDEVYVRGLIEFTNYCKNNCYYCGIRRDNSNADRYRLTKEEILSCCEEGYRLGFRTFVLQGGEDGYFTDDKICDLMSAIKEKYPEMIVVGTVGPFNEGTDYVEGWKLADKLGIPMVDEHYYQTPGWFLNNQDFYDKYDRSKKTKVYLGEYATHIPGRKANIETALTEALYLAALERNGDVVHMTSYAPLLAKEGHTQWNPDLIYFNNREVKPTTGYYVQKLYGQNAGNEYLPSKITLDNRDDQVRKRIASSIVRDSASGDVIVKLVNLLPVEVNTNVDLSGIGAIQSSAKRTVLTGKPADTPLPVEDTMEVAEKFDYQLPAYSFTVIRIKKANEK